MNPSIDILPEIKKQFEDGVQPDITALHVVGCSDGLFGLAVLRGTSDPEQASELYDLADLVPLHGSMVHGKTLEEAAMFAGKNLHAGTVARDTKIFTSEYAGIVLRAIEGPTADDVAADLEAFKKEHSNRLEEVRQQAMANRQLGSCTCCGAELGGAVHMLEGRRFPSLAEFARQQVSWQDRPEHLRSRGGDRLLFSRLIREHVSFHLNLCVKVFDHITQVPGICNSCGTTVAQSTNGICGCGAFYFDW